MPLYVDIHRTVDASPEEVAESHRQDVETQEKYDADFEEYWFDEDEGTVFCLFEAPDAETGEKVHDEAHGITPKRSTKSNTESNGTNRPSSPIQKSDISHHQ